MPAEPIDGKALAAAIRAEAAAAVAALPRQPGLAAILVGDDPASQLYVSLKERACAEVGIRFEKILLPADATQEELLAAIAALNARPDVDGILLQLPLPPQFDAGAAVAAIDPAKDADGFHPSSLAGGPARPVLAEAVMALLAASGDRLKGKRCLVIANSPEFYAPLEKLLQDAGCGCEYATAAAIETTPAAARNADVLIVAVGRPRFISKDMVKPGATVVDIGTNRLPEGKTVGDVDAATVRDVAGRITPVPGGVGPVTVAMLLRNVVALARLRTTPS